MEINLMRAETIPAEVNVDAIAETAMEVAFMSIAEGLEAATECEVTGDFGPDEVLVLEEAFRMFVRAMAVNIVPAPKAPALAFGTRVRLKREIERYPHFIAEVGLTGTVTWADGETVNVRMDKTMEGAETWDNEIVWAVSNGDTPAEDLEVLGRLVAISDDEIAALADVLQDPELLIDTGDGGFLSETAYERAAGFLARAQGKS